MFCSPAWANHLQGRSGWCSVTSENRVLCWRLPLPAPPDSTLETGPEMKAQVSAALRSPPGAGIEPTCSAGPELSVLRLQTEAVGLPPLRRRVVRSLSVTRPELTVTETCRTAFTATRGGHGRVTVRLFTKKSAALLEGIDLWPCCHQWNDTNFGFLTNL